MNSRLVDGFRVLTLVCVGVLIVLVIAGQLSAGMRIENWLRAGVFCVPLVLPLRGLIKRDRYTYRWATLCVLPYFVVALTEAFANQAVRAWATAVLGVSIVWFASLVGFLRVSAPTARHD